MLLAKAFLHNDEPGLQDSPGWQYVGQPAQSTAQERGAAGAAGAAAAAAEEEGLEGRGAREEPGRAHRRSAPLELRVSLASVARFF